MKLAITIIVIVFCLFTAAILVTPADTLRLAKLSYILIFCGVGLLFGGVVYAVIQEDKKLGS